MTPTILDRYLGLTDNAVTDATLLDELVALFDPDATVQLNGPPVRGHEAITMFYRKHFSSFTESRHLWTTTVLDDRTLAAKWVVAARRSDGQLITAAGIEHAQTAPNGLLLTLHNRFTRQPR